MSQSELVKATTDQNFKNEVLNASTVAVVDFWAEWCAPCKALAPIVDELASSFADKVSFFKINIDDNPEAPSTYGVRGIPTLIVFKNGEVLEQLVGVQPKEQLQAAISKHL